MEIFNGNRGLVGKCFEQFLVLLIEYTLFFIDHLDDPDDFALPVLDRAA